MIKSILDNDFYKFTMQKATINLFPRAIVKYEFINRAGTLFPDGFDKILMENIKEMRSIKLTKDEKDYLISRCYFLDPAYIDFLAGYRFDPDEVTVTCIDGKLEISIIGYWYRAILWEIPLMALVSELYFNILGEPILPENEIQKNAEEKMKFYESLCVRVSDFGTRRRYSYNNHDKIIQTLIKFSDSTFLGTSNVHFAQKYNVSPMGTQAHEWFMFHAAKYGFKMATKFALEHWIDIYRGDLGIALSDTFTTDLFYLYFDTKFAKLFDGVRHDSGDPIVFAEKTINHYKKLGIDPTTKSIVFSDSLTPERVKEIRDYCSGKIRFSFGIGTNFTNDVGVTPLNIVIKMTEAKPEGRNWVNTIKLSDEASKNTGDPYTIDLCKRVIEIH
ncbi:nicotinate phosphoribosyltransferase [Bacteroidales bacterium OttesenSCG-928-K03]|nr:nicotinate phosphoribosyltransferase [Odoribacter sp. OttesenSCG-928-L07]MDL2239365.1 nicotinate phosphoribosyltransferase [Bacteroidales bacterium OttesenSCG-928-L14]MDL2240580.1 nicotinate phosphoribosyltransferase [Bacteroidales bacterium OttesenSCG-928-K22]MDL2242359.1 nicotinate phosphoribosyltransferase [Bacteroidales bacterium OttesenSCG-928-K03]